MKRQVGVWVRRVKNEFRESGIFLVLGEVKERKKKRERGKKKREEEKREKKKKGK